MIINIHCLHYLLWYICKCKLFCCFFFEYWNYWNLFFWSKSNNFKRCCTVFSAFIYFIKTVFNSSCTNDCAFRKNVILKSCFSSYQIFTMFLSDCSTITSISLTEWHITLSRSVDNGFMHRKVEKTSKGFVGVVNQFITSRNEQNYLSYKIQNYFQF